MADEQDAIESHSHSMLVVHSYEIQLLQHVKHAALQLSSRLVFTSKIKIVKSTSE